MTISPEALVAETRTRFLTRFRRPPEALAVAPGRVNIIGEHTDYSGGFVLPAAIPMWTVVAVGSNGSREIRLDSTRFGHRTLALETLTRADGFSRYLAGAIELTGPQGVGLDLLVHGNLPVQGGLSSSASLLVAAIAALGRLAGQLWNPLEIALAARRVENDFVGLPCGFMDQFAVACGQAGRALLLDCRDNSHREVAARVLGHEWAVIWSGISRELTAGGYKERVVAVKAAVAAIAGLQGGPESTFLSTAGDDEVQRWAARAELQPATVGLLLHVARENRRVQQMAAALAADDAAQAGALLAAGHQSLSQLFGVSLPAIDLFVDQAARLSGVAGVRLTGAGLGGALVALIRSQGAAATVAGLEELARTTMAPTAKVYPIPDFVDGVQTWKL